MKHKLLWVLGFVIMLTASAFFYAIYVSNRAPLHDKSKNATYYSAKNGNDANPGTEAAPFLTIKKASGLAVAGDTIIVKDGTYKEMIEPVHSGSPGSPITYQVYPGDNVVIDGTGQNPAVNLANRSHIVFDGFEVAFGTINISLKNASHVVVKNCILRDSSQSSALRGGGAAFCVVRSNQVKRAANCGILLDDGAHDNLVEYNTIKNTVSNDGLSLGSAESPAGADNIFQYNDSSGNAEDGLDFYSGDRTTIRGNKLHDNNEKGLFLHGGSNCLVENNLVYGNGWYGFYLSAQYGAGEENRFQNNLFYDNGSLENNDPKLVDDPGAVINAPKNIFINNTFIAKDGLSREIILFYETAGGTVFYNNIFYGSREIYSFAGSAVSLTSDYNLFYTPYIDFASKAGVSYSNLAAWQAATGYDAHSVSADPLFKDYRNKDFSPASGSPAIDAGTSERAPTTDILGNARGVTVDIGAYEYNLVS